MENVTRISLTDTAKIVRAELKLKWPGTKFSVRSKSYSGGSSITVSFTDGPTQHDVDAFLDRFEGARFDSYQDMKTYHVSTYSGKAVRFGVDFVSSSRTESPELLAACIPEAIAIITKYGAESYLDELATWIPKSQKILDALIAYANGREHCTLEFPEPLRDCLQCAGVYSWSMGELIRRVAQRRVTA